MCLLSVSLLRLYFSTFLVAISHCLFLLLSLSHLVLPTLLSLSFIRSLVDSWFMHFLSFFGFISVFRLVPKIAKRDY